jgi:hypothetical protein
MQLSADLIAGKTARPAPWLGPHLRLVVIVVGTIRLIGSNANNVFSSFGSAMQ